MKENRAAMCKNELIEAVNAAEVAVTAALQKATRSPSKKTIETAFKAFIHAIEVKKARKEQQFALEYDKFYPEQRYGLLGLRRRSPEAGLAYLKWEAALPAESGDESVRNEEAVLGRRERAEAAKEALSLYRWLTEYRPTRPHPLEASGLKSIRTRHDAANQPGAELSSCSHRDAGDSQEEHSAKETCNSCLMDLGMAQSRAEALIYQYELEDSAAFSRLSRIPMCFMDT